MSSRLKVVMRPRDSHAISGLYCYLEVSLHCKVSLPNMSTRLKVGVRAKENPMLFVVCTAPVAFCSVPGYVLVYSVEEPRAYRTYSLAAVRI